MDQKLFSNSLEKYTGPIENLLLIKTINELNGLCDEISEALAWDDNSIALAVTVPVELPPLGNFQNLDILSKEPVLIIFNLKGYPLTAPWVAPDRLSFPKNTLGHMYVSRNGKPSGFCLVRGSMNEWYSNKRPKDLIIRVSNWLRDAAAGSLNEDGDQFEPLRLHGYNGIVIYDYDRLAKIVHENKSFDEESNFAIALFERNEIDDSGVFKLNKILTKETFDAVKKEFDVEANKPSTDSSKKNYHFGYILWSRDNKTIAEYTVELPQNWSELKDFCITLGIKTASIDNQIANNDPNTFAKVPFIVAIKRPKSLIGFSSNIDFINFYLLLNIAYSANGKLVNEIEVGFQKHNQPLTIKKAQEISGKSFELAGYTLFAGCGALGSKVAMHLIRNGEVKILFSDPDELAPHNLVRHVAFADGEGINKASYLKDKIKSMFPNDETGLSFAFARKGEVFLEGDTLTIFKTVLDFTASPSFFQFLVNLHFNEQIQIIKGALTDSGNLGILYVEGKDRNPRLDDLQASVYAHSLNSENVANWLRREANSNNAAIDVKVGIGCHSETTILSDDLVSLHASCMSGIIRTLKEDVDKINGKVYLNTVTISPYFQNTIEEIIVQPFQVLPAVNDSSWQIRIKDGLLDSMLLQLTNAYPKETGGLFIGMANFKTKTIHVVGLIDAPPDSKANAVCFFRGVKGLANTLDGITERSGGQIGYIGEWHTHPHGPNGMSITDTNTVQRFKDEFDNLPSPLPVFMMIITPEIVLPYVY